MAPYDRMHTASAAAQQRFIEDGRRFPPNSYEDTSLLWRGSTWRQPAPAERAMLMGLPTVVLAEILPGADQATRTAKLNSVIGNGFHLPSLMLALVVLFQLSDQAMGHHVPHPLPQPEERALLSRIKGTVFDQQFLKDSPHVMSTQAVAADMLRILDGIPVPQSLAKKTAMALAELDLYSLQAYWVYICQKGHTEMDAPPCWRAQKQRGLAVAAQGHQRASGNSSKGIDHLLPPGLGNNQHIKEASRLASPFSADVPLDLDLQFALLAVVLFWSSCTSLAKTAGAYPAEGPPGLGPLAGPLGQAQGAVS